MSSEPLGGRLRRLLGDTFGFRGRGNAVSWLVAGGLAYYYIYLPEQRKAEQIRVRAARPPLCSLQPHWRAAPACSAARAGRGCAAAAACVLARQCAAASPADSSMCAGAADGSMCTGAAVLAVRAVACSLTAASRATLHRAPHRQRVRRPGSTRWRRAWLTLTARAPGLTRKTRGSSRAAAEQRRRSSSSSRSQSSSRNNEDSVCGLCIECKRARAHGGSGGGGGGVSSAAVPQPSPLQCGQSECAC